MRLGILSSGVNCVASIRPSTITITFVVLAFLIAFQSIDPVPAVLFSCINIYT